LQTTKMRPTFSIPLNVTLDEAVDRLQARLASPEYSSGGVALGHCTELYIDASERRLWSPHLSIQLEEAEHGTVLNGRFSPRPEIWTFLMFVYMTMATTAFFGAALAYAQWVVGATLWGLAVAVLSVLAIVLLHGISLVGQRLSRHQMDELKLRLDTILEQAFPESIPRTQ
jgi:hypothetical protein